MGEENERQQQLEQALAEQTRKLDALYDVLEVVSQFDDLAIILERSLRRVLTVARVSVGAIHLKDNDADTLTLATQQGLTADLAAQLAEVAVASQPIGAVFRQRAVLLEDRGAARGKTAVFATQPKAATYLGIPIRSSHTVLGVLSLLAADKVCFTQPDIDLLTSLADQLGVTIENGRLRQKAEQLAVLQERNRLARELHDSVTQSLYSLTLFAEASKRTAEAGDLATTLNHLQDVGRTARQALKEMRLLVYKLRPTVLLHEGLVRAVQQRLNGVEGRAGIKHQLQADPALRFAPAVEDALYHICQEALNNSLKHALATEVIVRLEQSDKGDILLLVQDDGQGFDPKTAVSAGGLGLITMRERAEQLGGTISYQSASGQGTAVRVEICGSDQGA